MTVPFAVTMLQFLERQPEYILVDLQRAFCMILAASAQQ